MRLVRSYEDVPSAAPPSWASWLNDTTYIVLFRGVGGATQLPTAPLRAALTAAGFLDVATYINSGNAVVRSPKDADRVRAEIGEISHAKFGFTKDIMVASAAEWSRLVKGNPFPDAVETPTRLHAFLLEKKPARSAVAALEAKATGSERFAFAGRVLYLHTPEGFGTSKLAPVVERTLDVAATARNWNTVLRLHAMAQG